jgi:hypothetical protein
LELRPRELKQRPFLDLFSNTMDAEQGPIVRSQDMRQLLPFSKYAAHHAQLGAQLIAARLHFDSDVAVALVFPYQIALEARPVRRKWVVDDKKLIRDTFETLEPAQPRATGTISTLRPVSTQVAADGDM